MNYMSKEELRIAQIKNITSIRVYDLLNPSTRDAKKYLLGLIVFSESGNFNYCERDLEFPFFVQKVFEQYEREKDEHEISVDDTTKAIMEKGEISSHSSIVAMYRDKYAYNHQLISYNDKVIKQIESILIYHLELMFQSFKQKLKIEKINSGTKGNYWITGILSDEDNIKTEIGFPITLNKVSDFEYHISIGNIFENINFLVMKIYFKDNEILVELKTNDDLLDYAFDYQVKNQKLHTRTIGFRRDNLIHYDITDKDPINDYEKLSSISQFIELDNEKIDGYNIVHLPWNAFYLYRSKRLVSGERIDTIENDSIYLLIEPDYVNLKHYNEKGILISGNVLHTRTDGLIKNTNIYLVSDTNRYGLCETGFSYIPYALGIYKKNLANKYFYKVFLCKGDNFLDETVIEPTPIDWDLSPNQGYKLLDTANLSTSIKGGK